MRLQWRNLLLSSALLSKAWAKKDAPKVDSKKFDFIPFNLNYFEDSDVILFESELDRDVYRSEDAGVTWDVVDGVPKGKLLELSMHPDDHQRAYIITTETTHYRTSDRGKTWEEFSTDAQATIFREALTYHAGDPDRIIFNGMDCTGIFCEELTLYTTDGFAKDPKILRSDTVGCHWAKSSPQFTTGDADKDANRILCVVKGRFSPWRKDFRLLVSDDFFKFGVDTIQEFEPELEPGRTVQGIINMAVVTNYLIAAATAPGTDEMAMYVSDDTVKWHRAIFPHDHKLTEKAYTILEGTNYSIQIDVMTSKPSQPMGVFLSSNSNGTYFTRNIENTNRNIWGLVDFEKVSGIQGIVLVNVVDNPKDVEDHGTAKKIISKISFDDGRNFDDITCDGKNLHLHSVTDLSNSGRVFSSPAPGLIMGIGNTGDQLKDYTDGNLYVSDNAGLTWRLALKGPHKYEFGDQGSILVAIKDEHNDRTDEIRYSINHGKDWEKVDLGMKVRPLQLTTTQDSTSLKFLLEAIGGEKDNPAGFIIAIDFDGMHESQCKEKDMEDWPARVDEDGNPTCIMGHKQSYKRRKPDADCFLKKVFEDPEVISKPCECAVEDFECDYNFVRSADRKECHLAPGAALVRPENACKEGASPDDTFQGSSGWRKIPGNQCKGGIKKDEFKEWKCGDTGGIHEPASGKISKTQKTIPGGKFRQIVYLERTDISTGDDETLLARTDAGVFLSHDHGKTWKQILEDEEIESIYPHPHFKDVVFFTTSTKKVFYSTERGNHIRSFDAPRPPNQEDLPVMNFHWKNKDWIIWTGAEECDKKETCHSIASVTRDRGDDGFKTMQRYVDKCQFVKEEHSLYFDSPDKVGKNKNTEEQDKLIYCKVREKERNNDDGKNPWQLVSSEDFFQEPPKVHFSDVVDYATMSEFIVVATKDSEGQTLKVDASVDGRNFADAEFPHNFEVPHQVAYTVLDSSTHSVFMHVTVEGDAGFEYGTIIKSNSNGTSYVKTLEAVDRDRSGYVDFEKTFGLEGVAMVNTVENYNSKDYKKEGKKMKTQITHNDGAEWNYLPAVAVDADGKKYGCKGSSKDCSLNIHGYTERSDKSHTYSSSSAIGLMLATGNVGQYLTKDDGDTFMTSDGGINWMAVKKGKYMWEYGDQGSIVVIVKDGEATDVVHFTLDEGKTWQDFTFSDHEIRIDDITTVPSDNSRNFLLWAKDGGDLVTINLDFTGLTDNQCKLDEENVEAGDYYLWTPQHPSQKDDCLFGHVSQYHRKKVESTCYNGRMIPSLHEVAKNCTCSRRDYECDFNYQRQTDGSCALVDGLSPADHSLQCAEDPEQQLYYEPTGYRKLTTDTCQGGTLFEVSTPHPCPGHEEEFSKKHGASGVGIFFAIVIPIAAAAGIGYWVWRNWASKFGQIRLGEQSSFDGEAPWIKYPVLVVAGTVAVAQALPLLAVSLWRSASGAFGRSRGARFTTRDSFARGRGDYAVVDDDEGELLGEESDEEV
ncbi:Vacuolar protein sorting/targeting protein [Lachnellula occidentalis]|uniref:Vacuolar protein sorting/targeting protein 10 n=1 Tax=Lachnellula occidentalis TaxID=215460 RepID=A0A8H8RVP9_9HELO|nr:Vacuolar protein sorting/targeting protein [Lachnellula occidentalis]